MLTQQRAKELWEIRGMTNSIPHTKESARQGDLVHPNGLTPAEADYVNRLWGTMPGYTCWMDAFYRILNGKVEG